MESHVVFDNLSYFLTMENNLIVEGYQGLRIEENTEGQYFVVYKNISENIEKERRFVLPDKTLKEFMAFVKKCTDFFTKQKILFNMVVEVEKLFCGEDESDLKLACDNYYTRPSNYIKFVAMNMTKGQFFSYAKTRILQRQRQLLN